MQIYVDCKTENENGVPEWAIVELQGLVQMKESSGGAALVGDLSFTARSRQPSLVLGHHVLAGKEVKLDQPMAVIEKVTDDHTTRYRVRAVVKKKLLFKSRPKPIISNVAEKI
ncbi:chromosome transmission fidelity protein 8 homolog [Ostrinia nubilalis]|uniref:chromosome transmission fidelity protein 8 homolog n=1 Tax=Ostrinia nubilalis TaxID=29057 RepID=UPI0030824159